MLDIKLSDGTRRSWHVGQGNPVGYYEVEDVEEVQADGDELDHIQNMFLKTMCKFILTVVRWFGDHAKLIMGNL